MVSTPHPITITVNDTDNSTKVQNVEVYVRNTTKKTTSNSERTNASGVAIIDLANLSTASGQSEPYEVGDIILIIGAYGNTHDAAQYTVAGATKSQTLNLNFMRHIKGYESDADVRINAEEKVGCVVVANTSSTVYYARLLAVDDGEILTHIECPANDSRIAPFYKLQGSGGIVCIRENSVLIVTADRR